MKMSKVLERRAIVKRAWLDADGKPDRVQLAARFGVNPSTITRDIAHIRTQLALERDTETERLDVAESYLQIHNEVLVKARSDSRRISEHARAAYYRIAADVAGRYALLTGQNAPQRHEGQVAHTITVQHVDAHGKPIDVEPPYVPDPRTLRESH